MNPLGTGVLLLSKPPSALALTASLASASLTVEQFEFLAGCLLLLVLLVAVHLAIPVSRFEYDKQALNVVPRATRERRSQRAAGVVGDDHRSQQQLSRSKSINQQEEDNEQQQQQQQPPPSPPRIIRREQPNGFIDEYDCNDVNGMAAVDLLRTAESKGGSGSGTTMTEAKMYHQDEPNDHHQDPPAHNGMGGEEEMEMPVAVQNEEPCDGEIEKELAGEEEEGEEGTPAPELTALEMEQRDEIKDEKEDVIDFDNDIITEGRDDHDNINHDNIMEDSIEVQPNQKRSVLALVSEGVIDRVQSSNQRRALFLLDAKKVPYEKVDGMDPAQREVRDDLFELAGFGGSDDGDGNDLARKRKPVSYPQFFFVGDGAVSYVGDFERLLSLNDASDIPKEILDQHPELETWERVFVNLVDPSEIASP